MHEHGLLLSIIVIRLGVCVSALLNCQVLQVREDMSATSACPKKNPPVTFAKLDSYSGYGPVRNPDMPLLEVGYCQAKQNLDSCLPHMPTLVVKSIFFWDVCPLR